MSLLLLGVGLFIGLHLFTTILRPVRMGVIGKIGEGPWKGLIALGLIASLWLIGRGYGAASGEALWDAPVWMRHLAIVLMLPALILFVGSFSGSKMRALIRHPQLTGVKLWAVLHLLVNGDMRSLVLFGGLLAWAVVQVILLNKRDGKGPLPAPSDSPVKAWMAVPMGLVAWVGLMGAHQWLFGVSPFG